MMPKLYIFAISHYCEKTRFALDYLQLDYQLVYLAPGLHTSFASKHKLPASSLPILSTNNKLIQGSANIISWADSVTQSSRRLTPETNREECLQIENRLDEIIGVHTRRMFYSEALIEHSAQVRPIFTKDLTLPKALLISALWPVIRKKMIDGMDLGAEQGRQSMAILDSELAWLDGLLSDGRRFLLGDCLSRGDIAAASLLARLASPKEHPSFDFLQLPPGVENIARRWNSRPVMHWIRTIYQDFR